MNTLLDTVSIYGQNVTEFGMNIWDKALNDAFNIISGKTLRQDSFPITRTMKSIQTDPLQSYTLTEKNNLEKILRVKKK